MIDALWYTPWYSATATTHDYMYITAKHMTLLLLAYTVLQNTTATANHTSVNCIAIAAILWNLIATM